MKKLLSAILALVMMLSVCPMVFAADADGLVDSGIVYEDGMATFDLSTGRGIGKYYWIEAYDNGTTQSYTAHPSGLSTPMYDLSAFSAGNDFTHESYESAKPARVGGEDKEINEQTLQAIRTTFETARKMGVQCIPRFAYEQDGYVGAEPAGIDTILLHIEQLSEILNEYKDIVIAIEGGMIGPWGEMHSSMYAEKEYANAIIGAWIDNLDPSIAVLLRNPTMVVNYAKRLGPALIKDLPLSKDHRAYRIGMYNDGYLGTDADYGTWGSGLTRAQGVKFLKSQGDRAPYGGEMAHTTVEFLAQNNSPIYTDGFIKELYDSHLTYLRNLVSNSTGLQPELERLILDERYDFEGMPDYSEYYGSSLHKFMLDHMGYRFVLRDARLTASVKRGDVFRLTGKVENTGFANLYGKLKSEVLLINEEGEKIYVPVDVDPHAWRSCTTSTYDVSVTIPADAPAGEYTAYLRFSAISGEESNSQTRAGPFANEGVYEQKYNANNLGTFTVEEEVGGVADGYKQVYVDFDDVKDNHWAKDNIRQICISGLMGGMGAGKFAPEGTATRAQLVTILYRMEGSPDMGNLYTPLEDIDGWYEAAITWAYSEGIVNGVSATKFDPNGKLNRETFATMLYRYAQYKKADVSGGEFTAEYSDAAKVSSWALEAMKWANAKGLIGGMTATTLVPQGQATRAQMATILGRYLWN